MNATAASTRYSNVAIFLHWLIALVIIANIAIAFLSEPLFESADKADQALGAALMNFHKAAGITIIFLTLLRLVWRFANPPAPLPAQTPRWQAAFSRGAHALFYLLMIGVPLAGWLMSSAHPAASPIQWFGLFTVPQLPIADSKPVARFWYEIHEISAFAMIGLILLHVAAALKHHFIARDDVLRRMAPWIKGR